MFTGIVQAVGTVRSIRRGSTATRLALNAPDLPRPVAIGASICVSGVCLTVTSDDSGQLEFDVVPETLARSTLASLNVGARVNLEKALRVGDPLDGHTVQGHVDGIAQVRSLRGGNEGYLITFEANRDLIPYIIPKGSIAIDGVSLTIATVEAESFSVALIPTTLSLTTFGALKPGDRVNIETDILARTIVTTLQRWRNSRGGDSPKSPGYQPDSSALTVDSLRENGW